MRSKLIFNNLENKIVHFVLNQLLNSIGYSCLNKIILRLKFYVLETPSVFFTFFAEKTTQYT
jgi:hypothetical protein